MGQPWIVVCGLGLAMSGCLQLLELDEVSFGEKMSKEGCTLEKKCFRGYFDDEYSDMADCVDEQVDNWDDLADTFDDWDCDFESDEAAECLAAWQNATCEEHYEFRFEGDGPMVEDCEKVWDCD